MDKLLGTPNYVERLAREQDAIDRANKINQENERKRAVFEKELKILEEAKEKKRKRELKKKKFEEQKLRIIQRALLEAEEEERQKVLEQERLEKERLEQEALQLLEEERLRQLEEEAKKSKGKKGKKEKGKSKKEKGKEKGKGDGGTKAKKEDKSKKDDKKSKKDDKKSKKGSDKSSKGSKKSSKKGKNKPTKRPSITSEQLRQVFQDPELQEEIMKEHQALVEQEENYDDEYWKNIDYFDWDIPISLSSSEAGDDDEEFERKYPLTAKSRKVGTYRRRFDSSWRKHELRKNLNETLTSLKTIKVQMDMTRKKFYCHTEERHDRAEKKRKKVEDELKTQLDIDFDSLPKNSNVIEKLKAYQKEKEERDKGILERKIGIVQKLLNEEKRKHKTNNIRDVRSRPLKRKKIADLNLDAVIDLDGGGDSVRESHHCTEVVDSEGWESSVDENHPGVETATSSTKGKKGKKGKKEKKPKAKKEKKKKEKKKKKDKKGKKGKVVKEEIPPPPPLRRERPEPENIILEIIKDFEKTDQLEVLYEKDKLEKNYLPVDTAFSWKPSVVLFHGFKPEIVYKTRVQIKNVRSLRIIECRYLRAEYPYGFNDPMVLEVKMCSVKRVCTGLGFSFELFFYPIETTSSFKANLIFLTKTVDSDVIRQFHIPVECSQEHAFVKIVPEEIIFPAVPSWSNGVYKVALEKTVKVLNSGRQGCTLSVMNNQELFEKHLIHESSEDKVLNDVDEILDGLHMEEVESDEKWLEYLKNTAKCKSNLQKHLHRFCNEHPACVVYNSMSQWDLLDPTWSSENIHVVLACKDLVDECIDNVFQTFSFDRKYNIDLPPKSTTSMKLRFKTHDVGKFTDTFSFHIHDIEDETILAQIPFIVQAETLAPPFVIQPETIDMRVCIEDSGSYQGIYKVTNNGRLPCAVNALVPTVMRKYVSTGAKGTFVQPGTTRSFPVRFTPSWKIAVDAPRYFQREAKNKVKFPVLVKIGGSGYGQCPPKKVYIVAHITSAYDLVLNPPLLDLGKVSTLETVMANLQLSNHTYSVQDYAFLDLPNCVIIQPEFGFGKIFPGQNKQLKLLYTPSALDIANNSLGIPGLDGEHEFSIRVTTKACCGGVYKNDPKKIINHIQEENVFYNTIVEEYDEEAIGEENMDAFSIKSNVEVSEYSFATSEEEELFQHDLAEQDVNYKPSEAVTELAFYESDINKHFDDIMVSDDEVDQVYEEAKSKQVRRNVNFISSMAAGVDGSIVGGTSNNSQISERSMRNLLITDEEASIIDRSENLLDTRILKSEMKIKAYVYDPLCELSHNTIQLAATPCGSFSIAHIYLRGSNKGSLEPCYCGVVPKDGTERGKMFTATFEFNSTCDDLTFGPAKGRIAAGENVKIGIVFRPELPTHEVNLRARELKALRILAKKKKDKEEAESKSKKGKKGKSKSPKKEKSKSPKKGKGKSKSPNKKGKGKGKEKGEGKSKKTEKEEYIDPAAVDLEHIDLFPGEKSLYQTLEPYVKSRTALCVVNTSYPDGAGNMTQRREILKIAIICPVVKPDFVIQLDSQRCQFGPVAIGTRPKQRLGVTSISSKGIKVNTSLVNPLGPFLFPVPWIPVLEPEHTLNIPVTYAPEVEELTEEYVEISSGHTVVSLILTGTGVIPKFVFNPDFIIYRFESKAGKKGDCSVVIENTCRAPLPFKVELLFIREALDKPPPEVVVEEVQSKSSKGKNSKSKSPKQKKQKKPKKPKKPKKMAMEIEPEDDRALKEDFVDFESEFKNEIFTLVDLDENGEVVVPAFEKRTFKIRFTPPKSGTADGKSKKGSAKGKDKKGKEKGSKSSRASSSEKSESTKESSPKKDKKGKSRDSSRSSKSGKSSGKGVEKSYPKKYAAKFRISLGRIVEVRELIFMGFLKGGKKGDDKKKKKGKKK